ncbi:hypothetical protein R6V09_01150 [Streptomyces sp. W16]|uniref:hypothetical protein n=1 Tax=Streptomyces sp. W16 TaxID=3076631 RepID=UPI00295BA076|nr:hypothetical protein [Streptomyces sp. W16]MDV9168750.1 hypothetical protein [Streptomyces sp. W16]
MYSAQLPPNAVKLLALYLKPKSQWTDVDRHRAYDLVVDWTGEDHESFAAFLQERL